MTDRLAGKVALVCGAASGIGAAVVRRFSHEGACVVACGLPQPQELGLERVTTQPCDVRDEAQVQAVVQSTLARHARIDILVNAAGIVATDEVATLEDTAWQNMLDVNLGGTMRTMRATIPGMVARRAGAIVNIASVAAFNAGATQASYAAAKAAVVALTRSAAQKYGPFAVRANVLCPGWVDTPMSQREMRELAAEQGGTADEARERTVARIALGRMATADEIAAVCLFLASDDAAFVTGAALVVDGGTRVPAAVRAV